MRLCPLAIAIAILFSLAGQPATADAGFDLPAHQAATRAATRPATGPSLQTSGVVEALLATDPSRATAGGVVAQYDKALLTREQLLDFVIRTRGLDALLNLMQLQVARQLAQQENITVTPGDIEQEKRETLRQAFAGVSEVREDQYAGLLDQLLARQQLSRAEFDVVMATNAYLKALARPRIAAFLTDENVRKAFNARYGEQVRVRHIQFENLAQVAEVKTRIDAGEDFAKVAAEVSRNTETKQVGGSLPPFSQQTEMPEAFKQAAFALEVGKVSEPVEAGGFYHLIKLEERIAPQAVVFESVRDELKVQLTEEQALVVTGQLRRVLSQMLGSGNLKISDPVLAEQLRQRLAAVQPQPMNAQELRRQMEAERPTTGPATRPSGAPANEPEKR